MTNRAVKKTKRYTLKDAQAAIRAHDKRMEQHVSNLLRRISGLDERTSSMSRDVGNLITRANGVDRVLRANSQTHQDEVRRLSAAVGSLQEGQQAHASIISKLEGDLLAMRKNLDACAICIEDMNRKPTSAPVGNPSPSVETRALADCISNFVRRQPTSAICSGRFPDDLNGVILAFLGKGAA